MIEMFLRSMPTVGRDSWCSISTSIIIVVVAIATIIGAGGAYAQTLNRCSGDARSSTLLLSSMRMCRSIITSALIHGRQTLR